MKLTEIMKIRWNRNTTSRRSNISLDTCNTTHKSHCRQASVHDAALYLYPDKNQVVPIQKQKWTSRVSRRRLAVTLNGTFALQSWLVGHVCLQSILVTKNTVC